MELSLFSSILWKYPKPTKQIKKTNPNAGKGDESNQGGRKELLLYEHGREKPPGQVTFG
jgi:hypothetical protein